MAGVAARLDASDKVGAVVDVGRRGHRRFPSSAQRGSGVRADALRVLHGHEKRPGDALGADGDVLCPFDGEDLAHGLAEQGQPLLEMVPADRQRRMRWRGAAVISGRAEVICADGSALDMTVSWFWSGLAIRIRSGNGYCKYQFIEDARGDAPRLLHRLRPADAHARGARAGSRLLDRGSGGGVRAVTQPSGQDHAAPRTCRSDRDTPRWRRRALVWPPSEISGMRSPRCRASRPSTCAVSPQRSLILATGVEWPWCSAAASASAQRPCVPVISQVIILSARL